MFSLGLLDRIMLLIKLWDQIPDKKQFEGGRLIGLSVRGYSSLWQGRCVAGAAVHRSMKAADHSVSAVRKCRGESWCCALGSAEEVSPGALLLLPLFYSAGKSRRFAFSEGNNAFRIFPLLLLIYAFFYVF